MTHLQRIVGMALALTVAANACSRNPVPEAPSPPPAAAGPILAASDDAERAAREAAERAALAAAREAERARTLLQAMVFFDYDMAVLGDEARRTLDDKLPILRDDPTIRLRIEGHADERGSTEYNIALGNRRATSVMRYLADFGIDGSRFQTVSIGEERPLVAGQGEGAWAQNRRAEFIITAGTPVGRATP